MKGSSAAILAAALFGAPAMAEFNCTLYVSTCKSQAKYSAYEDCAGVVKANAGKMTCREEHLGMAATGNATMHCPHAQPIATGPCASETLLPAPTFDCKLYYDTCRNQTKYEAYQNCGGTVMANVGGMSCRIDHLAKATVDAAAATMHCPHAQPAATGPCEKEILKPVPTAAPVGFDCALYVSTCKSVTGYQPYENCAKTVANNPGKMSCRITHLQMAVADASMHCPHAAPTATGPCKDEAITLAKADVAASGAVASGPQAFLMMVAAATAVASLF